MSSKLVRIVCVIFISIYKKFIKFVFYKCVGAVDDPPTKFTDLPQFCVEKILSFLMLDDLNVVASTTDHLKALSIRVFNMKFKNELIEYYPNKYKKYFVFSHKYDFFTHTYDIGRMWGDFPLLVEQFGSMIQKLSITIPSQSTLNNLTKQFGSSLVELNVFFTRRNIRLTQPFINLTKLRLILHDFELNDSWFNLNHYFPKLRCLEIRSTWSSDYEKAFINHNFPNLEEFAYVGLSLTGKLSNGIIRFLNKNPQLNRLRLDGCLDKLNSIQQKIAWESFHIQHLDISTDATLDVGIFVKMKHLQSLKMMALHYVGLEKLKLNELKSASIGFRKIPRSNDFQALINLSPILNDLNISFNVKLTENVLKYIVRQCNTFFNEIKQLKEIKIQVCKEHRLERLKQFESIVGNKIVALAQQYPNRSIKILFGRTQIDLEIGVNFDGRFQAVYSKYEEEHKDESDAWSVDTEVYITDEDSESDEYSADFNFDLDDDSDIDADSNDSDDVPYGMKRPKYDSSSDDYY